MKGGVRRRDTLVLCYHGVDRHVGRPAGISRACLAGDVEALLRRGYEPRTFADAVLGEEDGRVLAVTFDDGLRSVFDHGLEVLEQLGVPATAFACSEHVDREGYLGAQELRALAAAGWEIGSHSATHRLLPHLDDGELAAELTGSREALESVVGQACVSLAYPWGVADARVLAAARAAGYRAACCAPRYARPDPLAVQRVGLDPGDGRFALRLKTSQLARSAHWVAVRAGILRG